VNIELLYQTLAKIIERKEGVKVEFKIEKREKDEH
jgi:hypothetical protein